MKTLVRTLFTLAVVALLAAQLSADDDAKKADQKKRRANRGNAAAARAVAFPKGIQATEEQQAKLKELRAQFGPKLVELNKKTAEIITPEQRKARAEAGKKARAEGKKGKELQAAVAAAVDISQEQKTQLAEVTKQRRALQQQIRQAVLALLTDEQKASLPKRAGAARNKANAEARKAAAEKRKAARKAQAEKKQAGAEKNKARAEKKKAAEKKAAEKKAAEKKPAEKKPADK